MATSSCWRSKRRMSIREDTPFSVVFSEFFGSTEWLRLGSPLTSLSVKERILNHTVSSSKESFLCSSETSLKKKHPKPSILFKFAFTSFKVHFHQARCLNGPSIHLLAEWSWTNQNHPSPHFSMHKMGMIAYVMGHLPLNTIFLIKYLSCIFLAKYIYKKFKWQ